MSNPQGNNPLAKHYYKVGSINHNLQVMGYNSGENLSPRSVLEQRALSGLAIAIALDEKKPWGKSLRAHEGSVMERLYSKERINPAINTNNERVVPTKEVIVGLRMVASMQMDGEKKKGNFLLSNINISSSRSPPIRPVQNLANCRSLPENRHNYWLNQHGHEEGSFCSSSSMGESIFYYANRSPPNSNYNVINDNHTCPPMEDILKCCFFCKCHLGVGKDIFMYRGDRAFCSVECRYQQIVKDECTGSSS